MNPFFHTHAKRIISGLCLLGMLRVFLFSAALPFFNQVDEQAHFDLVNKYSEGYLPRRGNNTFGRGSAELIALYGSNEFLTAPSASAETQTPAWEKPAAQVVPLLLPQVRTWTHYANYEAYSFPLYYAIAGLWYKVGKGLGLSDGVGLYGIRFLNALLYGALMVAAALLCRLADKHAIELKIALLIFLAVFPQDVFFGIGSDALSPLFFTLCLYFFLRLLGDNPSAGLYAVAGLLTAATILIKPTNVIILPALAIFIFLNASRSRRSPFPLFILLITTAAPVLLWMFWNAHALGDPLGSREKDRTPRMDDKHLGASRGPSHFHAGRSGFFP